MSKLFLPIVISYGTTLNLLSLHDASLEKRRKKMFDRVEYPSEKVGKSVVVINGILSVDNVQVFFRRMANYHPIMDSLTSLFLISSYNFHGFNKLKTTYLSSLLSKFYFLLLQELRLSDEQLKCLSSVSPNIAYTGVAGFDKSDVLAGRLYGGCVMLRHSNVVARVLR